MPRFSWMPQVMALLLMGMACSLFTAPISGAQNLTSTAEALAMTLPSGIPEIEGMPDIPGMPDVSEFLNPSGAPASEWKSIPLMPEASAGQEFNPSTYSFRAPGITGTEVEEFYDARLEPLGWSLTVRTNAGRAGSYMLFTKGTSALGIMVTESEGDIVVLLIMQ